MASTQLRGTINVPVWATGIIQQIASDYNRTDPPVLQWRTSTKERPWSTGRTMSNAVLGSDGSKRWQANRIVVTAGKSGMDQLHVLLHEAAHWLAGHEAGHSARFYHVVFALYKRYKVPMWYMYERECSYKQAAVSVGPRYFVDPDYRFYWTWYAHWNGHRQTQRTYDPLFHNDPNCDPAWNILFTN